MSVADFGDTQSASSIATSCCDRKPGSIPGLHRSRRRGRPQVPTGGKPTCSGSVPRRRITSSPRAKTAASPACQRRLHVSGTGDYGNPVSSAAERQLTSRADRFVASPKLTQYRLSAARSSTQAGVGRDNDVPVPSAGPPTVRSDEPINPVTNSRTALRRDSVEPVARSAGFKATPRPTSSYRQHPVPVDDRRLRDRATFAFGFNYAPLNRRGAEAAETQGGRRMAFLLGCCTLAVIRSARLGEGERLVERRGWRVPPVSLNVDVTVPVQRSFDTRPGRGQAPSISIDRLRPMLLNDCVIVFALSGRRGTRRWGRASHAPSCLLIKSRDHRGSWHPC